MRPKDFRHLEDLIRDHVLIALYYTEGNIAEAARMLGLHRTTLQMRVAKMRGQGWIVPCRCQFTGFRAKDCQNHNVPMEPDHEQEDQSTIAD